MKRTPKRIVDLLHAEIPKKISRNKFCIQTGLNQNSIDKYMAGITEPTQASLQKLSDYFGVPVAWLRGEGGTDLLLLEELKKMVKASIKKHVLCWSEDKEGKFVTLLHDFLLEDFRGKEIDSSLLQIKIDNVLKLI